MYYTVNSSKEAWNKANEIFPTDYMLDSDCTRRAGYDIYWSTHPGCNAWISDLGDRLEVNLETGESINIWIEEPKYAEYKIEDALKVIDDALYEIDDKVDHNLAKETGIKEARDLLYAAYAKLAKELGRTNPKSPLFERYNLDEIARG